MSSQQVASERNQRINDRFAARGQFRRILAAELEPRLRGAREALDNPPVPVVARERIERCLAMIRDECVRLDREDEADRRRASTGPADPQEESTTR